MVDTDAVFCLSEQLQGILNEIGKKKKRHGQLFQGKKNQSQEKQAISTLKKENCYTTQK